MSTTTATTQQTRQNQPVKVGRGEFGRYIDRRTACSSGPSSSKNHILTCNHVVHTPKLDPCDPNCAIPGSSLLMEIPGPDDLDAIQKFLCPQCVLEGERRRAKDMQLMFADILPLLANEYVEDIAKRETLEYLTEWTEEGWNRKYKMVQS